MDDNRFWSMIEDAWQCVGGNKAARQRLAEGRLSEDKAESQLEALEAVIPALQDALRRLTAQELLAFDRILEKKLYDIDRSEIQEHTDGSDDGFLYARGFIVAAGKAYYDAVNANPTVAMMDLECEDICYLPSHVYEEKFGHMPSSELSRETGSNRNGWPA